MTGQVFLVVGPSGAGKDTLLDKVKPCLPDHHFIQRYITRSSDSGGEDHIAISREDFDLKASEGGFCVHWYAHELGYGIDASLVEEVANGQAVIVNTSRGMIDAFRSVFEHVTVVYITASKEVLRERLLSRGRETVEQVESRLQRISPLSDDRDVVVVDNSGDLDKAAEQLLGILKRDEVITG